MQFRNVVAAISSYQVAQEGQLHKKGGRERELCELNWSSAQKYWGELASCFQIYLMKPFPSLHFPLSIEVLINFVLCGVSQKKLLP